MQAHPVPLARPWRGLLGLLIALHASSAMAQGSPAHASERELTGWIQRIERAGEQRNYIGTWVFTAANIVSSTKVARFGVGGEIYERVEALDGVQQRSFRHNDVIHTVWPASRLVTVERRTVQDQSAGMPQIESRLLAHYDAKMLGVERVAGRAAAVLLFKPRDHWRFAHRVWADKDTGLMLRADVLSGQGHVLESLAFSDVEIDARPTRDQMLNPAKRLAGYRVQEIKADPADLGSEGWAVRSPPEGFSMLGCVQRPIAQPGEDAGNGSSRVLQAVFSDGLSRVSVFIEATDPARPREALITNLGATHTLIKPRDGRWWITVMGDVPVATLKAFFDATVRTR